MDGRGGLGYAARLSIDIRYSYGYFVGTRRTS